MEICVELFLHFRRFRPPGSPDGPLKIALPDAATVADLLAALDIPDRAEKLVLVDGLLRAPETRLTDGQTVTVFPPLEGG